MRSVLYISGTRADYGPLRSTLQAIQAADDLDLKVLVTGMHLDPLHGETWREIEQDGFTIADRVYGRLTGDSLGTMAASVGLMLFGMSHAMERLDPDIVLVLGDRGEMLAGAMAGAFSNRAVVHLCGGSVSGSIDDSIRHAITKFAHFHMPAYEEFAERIIQMGEDPDRVWLVGLPGGDIRSDVVFSREQICADLGLPLDDPYIMVIQHPVTHSTQDAEAHIVETLEAVKEAGLPTLLANPNDDAGGRAILQKMQEYARQHPLIRVLEPVRSRQRFSSVLAHAGCLVGNSSCGTVEAMSVELPVVNVGDRQRGREATSCMLNVDNERGAILWAIQECLGDGEYRQRLRSFSSNLIARDTPSAVVEHLRTLDPSAGQRPKPVFQPRQTTKEKR